MYKCEYNILQVGNILQSKLYTTSLDSLLSSATVLAYTLSVNKSFLHFLKVNSIS